MSSVAIENKTDQLFSFQVSHQFTDHPDQVSEWKFLQPGEKVLILDEVAAGAGVHHWRLRAYKLIKAEEDGPANSLYDGERFLGEPYTTGDWTAHRADDGGEETLIEVFDGEVRLLTQGETTTHAFYPVDELF